MEILDQISEFVQKGRLKNVKELVQKALDEGMQAQTILNDGLMTGMHVIGEKFKRNEVYVPEVMIAARAMNGGIDVLKPALAAGGVETKGKAVIGTVKGDQHDIGKNLVRIMMEGKGIEVIDLGVDVSPEKFVQTAIDEDAQIIGCSALLTTTMGAMRDVVEEAKRRGIRDKVKIMIGGAPVTQEYCDEIGADYYTPDAASAADVAARICEGA